VGALMMVINPNDLGRRNLMKAKLAIIIILVIFVMSCGLLEPVPKSPTTQPPTPTQLAMVWQEIGTGDCTGQDVNFSDGATPDPNLAAAGLIAVCWDGQTYINGGEPGKAFCTYKSVTADQCVGGANIGVMYQAVSK